MTWALKRQFFYVGVLIVFFAALGFVVVSPRLNKMPTCTDGKQNGDETGVDCGGSCARACLFEVDEISVFWARAFEVVPGRYNAVAYLENHNKTSVIRRIKYRFRFSDKDNIYIGKREGETLVPPSGRFAIFEPAIGLGNSIPIYTSFEFTETPVWIQVPEDKINQLKILVSDIQLEDEKGKPRLSATVKNSSLFIVPEINVVAILYDKEGNAVSASRTYIERLDKEQSVTASFTWPEPFEQEIIAKEVILMYDMLSAKLK